MIAGKVILLLLVPCLLGDGALRLLYGKRWREEKTRADGVLIGWMITIGLAEAAHLGAVVLGRSFSDSVKLFLAGVTALSVMAGTVMFMNHSDVKETERLRVKKILEPKSRGIQEQVIFALFGVLALIQVLQVMSGGNVYPTGDMTAEAVNTILATDTVCQVNPMTGQAYVQGMPMRLKILCLPTFYAFFCKLLHVSATQLVWVAVPVITLLLSYFAFATVAKALFAEDARKRGIFLIFVVLILWVGNYMYGMDGFAVQYAGFRGVSIRMAVLLPYTFGLILRKKWRLLPFPILAEACIVWTLYGMGACFFVTAVMSLSTIIWKRIAGPRYGKEDDVCRN